MVDQNSLGNIMIRLSGIKSVSGRRVKDPVNFLDNLEEENAEMTGTAAPLPEFSNFQPPMKNTPEPDMGGELTSQSYDVRANSVTPPEQEGGFFSRLGSALADYVNPQKRQEVSQSNQALLNRARGISEPSIAQTPPIATAQTDVQEGLPPVTASEQEAAPGFWGSLAKEATKPYAPVSGVGNALSSTADYLKESFTPKIDPRVYDLYPNIQKPPELAAQQAEQKQLDQAQLDAAQSNPWQVAAYGATDTFANRPELVAEFQEYTGLPFDEQTKELTAKYEKILSDIENNYADDMSRYDEQEKRILQRILNNESTEADKYYVGLALLMPLIVGGLFGKEAGLGALAGGAKGIADVLGQRQKNISADEEKLTDIYKQKSANTLKRGELEIERLKIPEQVKKSLPEDEYKDLKGMDIYTFKDPETGEVVASGPEVLPDLYMDLRYGNTPKKREGMQEKASKLEEEKAAHERANQATYDVVQAASQLKDPGIFGKILAYALSEDSNGALKKIVRQNAPEIMIDGRKQNAAVYIDSKIEQIKDAYRRNEQMRAFTNTVAAHIGSMAENPQYSGLKPSDLIDQMLILRDRGQQFFVDRAESQGFLRQPLENKLGRINKGLYKGLNKKEEKAQLERDKQLMYESE